MKRCNVVHCKKDNDIYIGRPSKWGNPFEIGIDGCRADVIAKYRKYLLENKELMDSLPELKWKTLGCWCKPENCHGDVLVEFVSKLEDEELKARQVAISANIIGIKRDIKQHREIINSLETERSRYQNECGEIGHIFETKFDERLFLGEVPVCTCCNYCKFD